MKKARRVAARLERWSQFQLTNSTQQIAGGEPEIRKNFIFPTAAITCQEIGEKGGLTSHRSTAAAGTNCEWASTPASTGCRGSAHEAMVKVELV
jgi:hypothetical protein